MGKVMAPFLRSEAIEQGPSPRRLDSAFGRLAQEGFELGEDLFNRVEIGRIGREEAEGGPGPFNGQPHSWAFVAAEIVQDDDVAGRQGGGGEHRRGSGGR